MHCVIASRTGRTGIGRHRQGEPATVLDQLRNPARLLGDKRLKAQAARFDFVQRLFLDRGHPWIGDRWRHGFDQGMGRC